jgi:hypothetical protein
MGQIADEIVPDYVKSLIYPIFKGVRDHRIPSASRRRSALAAYTHDKRINMNLK